MSRSYLSLLVLAGGLVMLSGCDDEPSAALTPAVTATPPAQPDITTPLAPPTVAPPPPGAGGPPPAAGGVPAVAPADPNGPLQNLVRPGDIYFYDKNDVFLPKEPVDFLQRAVQSYMDTRKYKADDSPDWPLLTDLGMLVQYKVIRALPAAPPGQQFVLDPATRKVSLAAK